MSAKKDKTYQLLKILFAFLVLELVIGGSGHLFTIGSLSLRTIIFLFVLLVEVALCLCNPIVLNKSIVAVILFYCYVLCLAVFSMLGNSEPDLIVDELLGYSVFLITPFCCFVFYYKIVSISVFKKVFLTGCFIISALSLGLWGFAFMNGINAYPIIEYAFLRRFSMGSLAISGSMTRLFMKGTVFSCMGFLFSYDDWIRGDKSLRNFIQGLICLCAVLVSFTLGIYVSLIICVLLIILLEKQNPRTYFITGLMIILSGIVVYKIDLIDLMVQRFQGNYNLSYKFIQTQHLIEDWSSSPVWGKGLGHVVTIDYGYSIRNTYRFENMWAEILNHMGFLGLFLYIAVFVAIVHSLYLKYKKTKNSTYVIFGIGIILLGLESASNPFLNNAIGITYLCLCLGITVSKEDLQSQL